MGVRVDHGWAWLVMIAAFGVHFISGGLQYTAGIVRTRLLTNSVPEERSYITWLVSVYAGLFSITGPFTSALVNRFGCRKSLIIGGTLQTVGFISSYFVKDIKYLSVTYSLLAGLGAGICYVTAMVAIGYHFDRYLGLASGIAVSGQGFGLLVIAPVLERCFDIYGVRGSFLILAGLVLHLLVFGALLRPSKIECDIFNKHQSKDIYNRDSNVTVIVNEKQKVQRASPISVISNKDTKSKSNSGYITIETVDCEVTKHGIDQDSVDSNITSSNQQTMTDGKVKCGLSIKCIDQNSVDNNGISSNQQTTTDGNVTCGASIGCIDQNCVDNNGTSGNQQTTTNGKINNGDPIECIDQNSVDNNGTSGNQQTTTNGKINYGDPIECIDQNSVDNNGTSGDQQTTTDGNVNCAASIECIHQNRVETNNTTLCDKNVLNNNYFDKIKKDMPAFISNNVAVLRNLKFVMFLVFIFFFSTAEAVTYILLPNYFIEKGANAAKISLIFSVIGICSTFTRFTMGLIVQSNKIPISFLFSVPAAIIGICSLCLPYFSHTFSGRLMYGILYGIFDFSVYSLINKTTDQLVGVQNISTAIGLEMLVWGVTTLFGSPLADAITLWTGSSDAFVVFVGIFYLLGSLTGFYATR